MFIVCLFFAVICNCIQNEFDNNSPPLASISIPMTESNEAPFYPAAPRSVQRTRISWIFVIEFVVETPNHAHRGNDARDAIKNQIQKVPKGGRANRLYPATKHQFLEIAHLHNLLIKGIDSYFDLKNCIGSRLFFFYRQNGAWYIDNISESIRPGEIQNFRP